MNALVIKTGNTDLFEINTRVLMRRLGESVEWFFVVGAATASRIPKREDTHVLELDVKHPIRSAQLFLNHLRTHKPEIVFYGYDDQDGFAFTPLDILIAFIPWNRVYIAHRLKIVEYKNRMFFIARAFIRLLQSIVWFLVSRKTNAKTYTLGFSDELLNSEQPVDFDFVNREFPLMKFTTDDETRSATVLRSGEKITIKSEQFTWSNLSVGFTRRNSSEFNQKATGNIQVNFIANGCKENMVEQESKSLLPGWNDHLIELPKKVSGDCAMEFTLDGQGSDLAISFPTFIKNRHKKNIIVIVLDGINLNYLGIYNPKSEQSQNIDHFFEDKLKYTRAYTQEIWTRPTFASMFTGYYPSHHQMVSKTLFSELPKNLPHLAEELRKADYHTVGYVSHGWANQLYGYARGFDRFLWRQTGHKPTHNAKDITYFALETLQNNRDRDLFMFLHYFDTHFPFFPRSPYTYHGRTKDFRKAGEIYVSGKRNKYFSPEDRELVENEARNKVREIDRTLDPLFLKLNSSEFRENTSVILTTDHGFGCLEPYAFLENGFFRLTDETVHIPLLVSLAKNRSMNQSVLEIDSPVEASVDLFASVMDLADAKCQKAPYSSSYIPNRNGNIHSKPFVISEALYFDSYQLTIRNKNDLYYYRCKREPNHYKVMSEFEREEKLFKNASIPNNPSSASELGSTESEFYRRIREQLGIAEYWRVPPSEQHNFRKADKE